MDASILIVVAAVFAYCFQVQKLSFKTRPEMIRGFELMNFETGQNEAEIFHGAVNIRAMQKEDYATSVYCENLNWLGNSKIIMMYGFQWFSMVTKKASMFITITAGLYVVRGKYTGVDPIMSLLLF
jgi:hypothetical protein